MALALLREGPLPPCSHSSASKVKKKFNCYLQQIQTRAWPTLKIIERREKWLSLLTRHFAASEARWKWFTHAKLWLDVISRLYGYRKAEAEGLALLIPLRSPILAFTHHSSTFYLFGSTTYYSIIVLLHIVSCSLRYDVLIYCSNEHVRMMLLVSQPYSCLPDFSHFSSCILGYDTFSSRSRWWSLVSPNLTLSTIHQRKAFAGLLIIHSQRWRMRICKTVEQIVEKAN